jgi:Xaa-Pro dipeptidase
MNSTVHHTRVVAIQKALEDMGTVDGWLFYDFRGSDPLAYRVLLLDPTQHVTRRWYYWIPTTGEPVKLLHKIEPYVLDELPGSVQQYVSWEQQRSLLAALLRSRRRIAMQYSPLNAVPYLSRVDAGTVELIRSLGPEVATSADLVQRFEAVWTDQQLASHRYAVTRLRGIRPCGIVYHQRTPAI